MKVILQREVDKLGVPGDLVEVKDGFARNYLIPRGLAAPATKGGAKHAERLRRTHQDRVAKERTEADALAARLAASPLRITAKAGEEGRLFGSITAADVADELQKATGATVDRKRIRLEEPIRSVGTHEVAVHLHPELDAALTIEVVAE